MPAIRAERRAERANIVLSTQQKTKERSGKQSVLTRWRRELMSTTIRGMSVSLGTLLLLVGWIYVTFDWLGRLCR